MMKPEELKSELFRLLKAHGAVLCGVGDLSELNKNCMKTGISAAVPVPAKIVEDLKTAPTVEYYHAYYALNKQLNEIVTAGADFLIKQGFQSMAQTTDAVAQNENWETMLPHKTVATRAGIGWIGKNCLLVTAEYGSAVRLSSLLTDAVLPYDMPMNESRCGGCHICVNACPAKALTGKSWSLGVKREELFHKERCKETQLERMYEATGISQDLCGLCFAVCPYTARWLEKENL